MNNFLLKKLTERRIWERIWRERLTEPLHLNLAALFVSIFGSFRARVDYDLVLRAQHAWGLLQAADWALKYNIKKLAAIEFGVASGAGLMNLAKVANEVTAATGVEFSLYGFDCGDGMPLPRDFRDHPEHYKRGDYPMVDPENLRCVLPKNTQLLIGDISDTVPKFLQSLQETIGFISFDVDYYWSTMEALKILSGPIQLYLPWVVLYFDDIQYVEHNQFAGQLLAINDFNKLSSERKIDKIRSLAETRLFRKPRWIHQMYLAHFFDHSARKTALNEQGSAFLSNPYLTNIANG